jgi:hypothetical protein
MKMVLTYGNAQGRASIQSDAVFLGLRSPSNLPAPLYISHISLLNPIARFTAPCGRPTPYLPQQPSPCMHPHPVLLASRSCPSRAPTRTSRPLLPAVLPTARLPAPLVPAPSGASPASVGARGTVARLRSVPGRAKGRHESGPCWWCSSPEARINRPRHPLICCKCKFHVFQIF